MGRDPPTWGSPRAERALGLHICPWVGGTVCSPLSPRISGWTRPPLSREPGAGGVMQALPWGPGWEAGGMRLSRGTRGFRDPAPAQSPHSPCSSDLTLNF